VAGSCVEREATVLSHESEGHADGVFAFPLPQLREVNKSSLVGVPAKSHEVRCARDNDAGSFFFVTIIQGRVAVMWRAML
jgi:hypothetical protein